ncbi:MAG TPA: hypothetical protein VLJ16_02325 [Acidobacteriota bacterium]|nr:hypothetical protein [Acidobacteriota bacterium]
MNGKRFLWASLAVLVVRKPLDYLIDAFILTREWQKTGLLRPDVPATVPLMFAVGVLASFVFTFIFIKGYEGKGIWEGVRFGVIISLFSTVPTGLGAWMIFPVPISLVLIWILNGLFLNIVSGIVAAAVYRPATPAKL